MKNRNKTDGKKSVLTTCPNKNQTTDLYYKNESMTTKRKVWRSHPSLFLFVRCPRLPYNSNRIRKCLSWSCCGWGRGWYGDCWGGWYRHMVFIIEEENLCILMNAVRSRWTVALWLTGRRRRLWCEVCSVSKPLSDLSRSVLGCASDRSREVTN